MITISSPLMTFLFFFMIDDDDDDDDDGCLLLLLLFSLLNVECILIDLEESINIECRVMQERDVESRVREKKRWVVAG